LQCGNSNIASFQSLKGWFNKAKQNCEQVLEKYSEPLQFGNRAIQLIKEAVQKYMKASKIDLSIHSSGLVGDVATDLFQIGSNDYIALVDRYSGWPMCAKLRSKTTESSTPL
jgi:hypothetical protein